MALLYGCVTFYITFFVSGDCVLAVSVFLRIDRHLVPLYSAHYLGFLIPPEARASMRVLVKVFQEFSLESSSTRYNSRQVPRLDKCASLLCSSCQHGLSLPGKHSGKSVDRPTSPSSETRCATLVKALNVSVMHPRKRRFY